MSAQHEGPTPGRHRALTEVVESSISADTPRAGRGSPLAGLPAPDALVPDEDYRRGLDWLYGRSAVQRTAAAIRADHSRKLARMRALLDRWGAPQHAFPAVLVAGTKGKGSTAAMLASVLSAGGYRVGRYTQPHLVSYRERVWVGGAFVSTGDVVRLVSEAEPLVVDAERQRPDLGRYTTFEVGTAMAFAHFAHADVDLAVVEVGVGGAHDATNVLEPLVSVVTPISGDHLATIGPRLTDVAREKAGVLRCGHPAVLAEQVPSVQAVLEAVARAVGARPTWLGHSWRWEAVGEPAAASHFSVVGPGVRYADLSTPLLGRHQRANATLAVAAANALGEYGFPVGCEAVAVGLAGVAWPGRVQFVAGAPAVVVDGAHNVASAATLRATVAECFPGRETCLVLGCTADKDVRALVGELVPLAPTILATRSRHARAAPAESVAAAVRDAGGQAVVVESVDEAIGQAIARSGRDGLVVVAGSLFVAGEAVEVLDRRVVNGP
jgi:dihydrofolate synthase / folylpolyglutamate synthase